MPPDSAMFVSIDDVMARFNISRTTVRELLERGELSSVKIGRRRLVSEDSLRRYVERLTAGRQSA